MYFGNGILTTPEQAFVSFHQSSGVTHSLIIATIKLLHTNVNLTMFHHGSGGTRVDYLRMLKVVILVLLKIEDDILD